jgi:hypothetical protein
MLVVILAEVPENARRVDERGGIDVVLGNLAFGSNAGGPPFPSALWPAASADCSKDLACGIGRL